MPPFVEKQTKLNTHTMNFKTWFYLCLHVCTQLKRYHKCALSLFALEPKVTATTPLVCHPQLW